MSDFLRKNGKTAKRLRFYARQTYINSDMKEHYNNFDLQWPFEALNHTFWLETCKITIDDV